MYIFIHFVKHMHTEVTTHEDHQKNKAHDGKGDTITLIWPVDVHAPEGSLYPRVGQRHSNE